MRRGVLLLLVCAPSLVFAAIPIIALAALDALAVELAGVAVSIIVFYVSVISWRFVRRALGMKN